MNEGMVPQERSKQEGRGVGKNPGHHKNVVSVARPLSPGPERPLENILRRSLGCPGFWGRECVWLALGEEGGSAPCY